MSRAPPTSTPVNQYPPHMQQNYMMAAMHQAPQFAQPQLPQSINLHMPAPAAPAMNAPLGYPQYPQYPGAFAAAAPQAVQVVDFKPGALPYESVISSSEPLGFSEQPHLQPLGPTPVFGAPAAPTATNPDDLEDRIRSIIAKEMKSSNPKASKSSTRSATFEQPKRSDIAAAIQSVLSDYDVRPKSHR